MPLVAEFDINCEHLPFVPVARTVPDAILVLTLQFNHDELPLFVLSVTDGNRTTVEETFDDLPVVGEYTVRGVSLDVAEGEFFGFLGPNGAGKTTTILIANLLTFPLLFVSSAFVPLDVLPN